MRIRTKKLGTLLLVGCVLLFGALNVVLMQLIHSASSPESVLAYATASWHLRVLDSLYSPFSGSALLPLLAASAPYPILGTGAASVADVIRVEPSSRSSPASSNLVASLGHLALPVSKQGAVEPVVGGTEPDGLQQPAVLLEEEAEENPPQAREEEDTQPQQEQARDDALESAGETEEELALDGQGDAKTESSTENNSIQQQEESAEETGEEQALDEQRGTNAESSAGDPTRQEESVEEPGEDLVLDEQGGEDGGAEQSQRMEQSVKGQMAGVDEPQPPTGTYQLGQEQEQRATAGKPATKPTRLFSDAGRRAMTRSKGPKTASAATQGTRSGGSSSSRGKAQQPQAGKGAAAAAGGKGGPNLGLRKKKMNVAARRAGGGG